jgi:hypothetical protein
MGVPNLTLRLELRLMEPFVHKPESSTTVVVLSVVNPLRHTILEHGAVFRHTVPHASQDLGKVDRGVGIMVHAQE